MNSITVEAIQETLRYVTLKQLHKLPEISAIYYVVVNERMLYVGQAANLKSRWQSHHRTLQLMTFTYVGIPVHIYWRECEKSLLSKEELKDIQTLSPPLNRSPILEAKSKTKNSKKDSNNSNKSFSVQNDCIVVNLPKESIRRIQLGLEAGFSRSEVSDKCILQQTNFKKIVKPYAESFINRSIIATWYFSVEGLSKEEAIDKALKTKSSGGSHIFISSPDF